MPQGHNITNPMPDGSCRVQGDINKDCFDYFFRKLFAGERGPREAFICIFFAKFHKACLNEGIEPVWDENNEPRVAAILNRLNFHDVEQLIRDLDAARAAVGATQQPKPSRPRRTARASAVPQAQPDGEGHERGSAD